MPAPLARAMHAANSDQRVPAMLGVVTASAAVLLAFVLTHILVPSVASVGGSLPAFTTWWLSVYQWIWIAPLLVCGAWWVLAGHARRGVLTQWIGIAIGVLIDAMAIIASFLPIIAMPGMV